MLPVNLVCAWRWLLAVCLAASPAAAAANTAAGDHAHLPNIILIVVEDLSPRIGAFGDPVARTPNIDRLAARGIRYTNVFTAAGVCAPSRAALIMGAYPQSTGTQHMRTSSLGRSRSGEFGTLSTPGGPYEAVPPANMKAFPELLRRHGYYTVNRSKTDYQIGTPFTIWDDVGPQADFTRAPEDRPFFAMFSNFDTHESRMFRPGWANKTEGAAEQADKNQAHFGTLDRRTDPADVSVPPFLPDTLEVRRDIAQLYDGVAMMDRFVGNVLDQLEKTGRADNTIIIWTTDHGDGLPRAKRSLYDSGLEVPMVITFPDGRGAGTVDDRLISFVDMAPAILDMAKTASPGYLQGRSFMNGSAPVRSYVYAARGRLDEAPDRAYAVRDRRFKYIRNDDADRPFFAPLYFRENLASMAELRRLRDAGELDPVLAAYFDLPRPHEELYDLQFDPFELKNLAADPAMGSVKDRMAKRMDRWLEHTGDLGQLSEVDMVEQLMWPGFVQPETAPVAMQFNAGTGLATLASATPGASIAYRTAPDEGWTLYTRPFALGGAAYLQAKAVRYGYAETATIDFSEDLPR